MRVARTGVPRWVWAGWWLVAACVHTHQAGIVPAPAPANILGRSELQSATPGELLATIRALRPRWFEGGEPRIVVDLEPVPAGAALLPPVASVNQVVFFGSEIADSLFATSDERALVAVYTSAGVSRSRTALRFRRAEGQRGARLETRLGVSAGPEWLDGGNVAPAAEARVTTIILPQLSFTLGAHQSTHRFERSFGSIVTRSPLRFRYVFAEPRYQLVVGDGPILVPFAGLRVFHGGWRLIVAHPLDPSPQVLEASHTRAGFSAGATLVPWRHVAVEASVNYVKFPTDLYAFGNIGFILNDPIRIDGGKLMAMRLGTVVRF